MGHLQTALPPPSTPPSHQQIRIWPLVLGPSSCTCVRNGAYYRQHKCDGTKRCALHEPCAEQGQSKQRSGRGSGSNRGMGRCKGRGRGGGRGRGRAKGRGMGNGRGGGRGRGWGRGYTLGCLDSPGTPSIRLGTSWVGARQTVLRSMCPLRILQAYKWRFGKVLSRCTFHSPSRPWNFHAPRDYPLLCIWQLRGLPILHRPNGLSWFHSKVRPMLLIPLLVLQMAGPWGALWVQAGANELRHPKTFRGCGGRIRCQGLPAISLGGKHLREAIPTS